MRDMGWIKIVPALTRGAARKASMFVCTSDALLDCANPSPPPHVSDGCRSYSPRVTMRNCESAIAMMGQPRCVTTKVVQ